MANSPFQMRFDPKTIKHLGVRMYSTLPPALAEIVSNSADADAANVTIYLTEQNGKPTQIRIEDDGIGMSLDEINNKFLVIGRDRRADGDNKPSRKHKRLPTGKKGLGKLAFFGLATTITVLSRQKGILNELVLDWNDLIAAIGNYRPRASRIKKKTKKNNGTIITLTGLKRTSPFDTQGLAESLSRIFVFDDNFNLIIESPSEDQITVDNKLKYTTLNQEFEWDLKSPSLLSKDCDYFGKITGQFLTSKKPLKPSSGLRGITLFSRGKLVNAPEFFSNSTSSHFYQYLTGWITVDFIDLLEEDVIATNRQSINWEHPDMEKLRSFLSELISKVSVEWRKKRKENKNKDLIIMTGIDTQAWMRTLPQDVKEHAEQIIGLLEGQNAFEEFPTVIKALHELIPKYPLLHWRHLHEELRERIRPYYEHRQYGDAASQGVQIYCEIIRILTGRELDGRDLVQHVFGKSPFDRPPPELQITDLKTDSQKNIQEGQGQLSRGVVTGFRNPISHDPIDTVVPAVFSELDCLNILSLVSYLLTRLDGCKVNTPNTNP